MFSSKLRVYITKALECLVTESVLNYCFLTYFNRPNFDIWSTPNVVWRHIKHPDCSRHFVCRLKFPIQIPQSRPEGYTVYWVTAVQVGTSRVRFPMGALRLFIELILPATLWSWVDSASNINKHKRSWRSMRSVTDNLHVPIVWKSYEPQHRGAPYKVCSESQNGAECLWVAVIIVMSSRSCSLRGTV